MNELIEKTQEIKQLIKDININRIWILERKEERQLNEYSFSLVSNFANRFKKALEINNIKPSHFAEMVDINKSTISQYISGVYEVKKDRLALFSSVLNVNEAWLMGYDVPMRKNKGDE